MKRSHRLEVVSLILIHLINLPMTKGAAEIVGCNFTGTAGFNRDITITVEHNSFVSDKTSLRIDPDLWALQNPPIAFIPPPSGPEADFLVNGTNSPDARLYGGSNSNVVIYIYPDVTGGIDTIVIHNFHMPKTPTWFYNQVFAKLGTVGGSEVDCDFHSLNSNSPNIISSMFFIYNIIIS